MLRSLLASLLLACACGVGLGQASGPKLFSRLTVNQTHIAFSYAGDIWAVERAGGEARRLTNHMTFLFRVCSCDFVDRLSLAGDAIHEFTRNRTKKAPR